MRLGTTNNQTNTHSRDNKVIITINPAAQPLVSNVKQPNDPREILILFRDFMISVVLRY